MKIAVVGCGYLGAVHAASMAELGHEVIGIDTRAEQIERLNAGVAPFYEPGLPELLERHIGSDHLKFSTEISDARGIEIYFIGVGTPQKEDSLSADLSSVWEVARQIAHEVSQSDIERVLVVGKSTVPVGTARSLSEYFRSKDERITLIWNPEFLREGYAVLDTLHPDRMVYGMEAGTEKLEESISILDECYRELIAEGIPRLVMDYESSELVKVAANAFLATKISFINAISDICDEAGGDIISVADAIGMDIRIGRRFLGAGIGFGGGCLPKDTNALVSRANELGVGNSFNFLQEVVNINEDRVVRAVNTITQYVKPRGKIAILGCSFKAKSDDIRESQSIAIAQSLHDLGFQVVVHDPQALPLLKQHYEDLETAETIESTVNGAELVAVLTDWPEYRQLDPRSITELVVSPVIFDGRNALDANKWAEDGWEFLAPGRMRSMNIKGSVNA